MANDNIAVFYEQRVDCSPWLGFEADGTPRGGTADAVVVDLALGICWVIDLKTGQMHVSANDGQLGIYALGVWYSILEPAGIEIEEFRLRIVQPRINNFDEHSMTFAELMAFGEEVAYLANLTQQPGAALVPGEKQCKFCGAKGNCPAAAEAVFATVPAVSEAPINIEGITSERLGYILQHADWIEGFLTAAREEAHARIKQGNTVPGWKLVTGKKGNRKWSDKYLVADYLSNTVRLKRDVWTKSEILSPAQMAKLVKSEDLTERQMAKLEQWITQDDGKPALAHESDPRPALAGITTPEDAFLSIE